MERDPLDNSHLSSESSYDERIRQSREQGERLRHAQNQALLLPLVDTVDPSSLDQQEKEDNLAQTRANNTADFYESNQEQYRIPLSQTHLISENVIPSNLNLDTSVIEMRDLANQIKQPLDQSVKKAVTYMGKEVNEFNLSKASESHQSLKGRPEFQYNQETGLYWIDFVSQKGISIKIGDAYIKKIKNVNNYLVNSIKIGSKIKHDQIKLLLGVEFESLQYLELERKWQKGTCEQHKFDIITNPANRKNIKHLTLKGNYFSPEFLEEPLEEPSRYDFPELEVLELNFDTEIESQQLFHLLDRIGDFNYLFSVKLWSSRKLEELKGDVELYHGKIKIEWRETKLNQKMIEELEAIRKKEEEARRIEQARKEELAQKEKQAKKAQIARREEIARKEKAQKEKEEWMKEEASEKSSGSYSNNRIDNKNAKFSGDFIIGPKGNYTTHYHYK